jgi:hypothetical protein
MKCNSYNYSTRLLGSDITSAPGALLHSYPKDCYVLQHEPFSRTSSLFPHHQSSSHPGDSGSIPDHVGFVVNRVALHWIYQSILASLSNCHSPNYSAFINRFIIDAVIWIMTASLNDQLNTNPLRKGLSATRHRSIASLVRF